MSLPITSLSALINRSADRQDSFLRGPFAALVQEGALDDPSKRNVFLACVRRFSVNFQTLLFTRQALCTDPRYYGTFLRHLSDELGHDSLLSGPESPEPIQDTLFEAMLSWFNYQMVVLDNAERAALMHLVLEAAGDRLHSLLAPRLREHVRSGYFDVHAELDSAHARLCQEVLRDLSPANYQRAGEIVDRGWDMMEAITERVCQLVEEN